MDRILILGASGLVGKALLNELSENHKAYGTYNENKIDSVNSINFDLSELFKIIDILNEVKPLKIIYCLRGDFICQIELLKELIKYLKFCNGKLYFCSTANVFDGETSAPHYKNEESIAESEYGKFKIDCEEIINKGLGDNGIIFRLPMIWGKNSQRLNSLVTALDNNEKVEVYTNLFFNSNTDVMLAKQISYIIENDLKGIFHLGSNEATNYYEFVKKIVTNLGYNNVKFKEEELPAEKHYFAILPTDGDLPEEFNFSNENVISYLTTLA